jgi:exodeoxyribonuclease VII small subunit
MWKGRELMAKKTFEQSMKELEHIVHELESGDLPLEKALKKFEEGMMLSKACSGMLDETEKKITLLLKDQAGNVFEKPFIDNALPGIDEADLPGESDGIT